MLHHLTHPFFWLARIFAYTLAYLLLGTVHSYRFFIAPMLPMFGVHCRFQPSCSQYAITALHHYGGFYGSWLVIKRLGRCRPHIHDCYGKSHGYDPVPDAPANKSIPKHASPYPLQLPRDKP